MFQPLEPRVVLAALAWYPLDELSGTVATDASGNGYDGTVTGGAWTDGKVDGAIEFNVDGNISVPATAFANVDQEITFAFWAYGGDTQPAVDSVLYGVNSDGDRVFNVHLPYSNDKIYWDAGEDGGYDRIFKGADPLVFKGSWHHWAFTKDASTGNMNIYLDGSVWHSDSGKSKSMAGVTSFTLGANTDGSSGYDGLLDDVRIYDHALTSAEVLALFSANLVNDPPTGTVTIDGIPATGQTLTASNTLADSNGLGTISYQWRRDGVDISGATGGSYALGVGDINALMTVVASYIDGQGTSESVSSSPVGPVGPANNFTVNSLAELRAAGTTVNGSIVTLSTTGGDPHPVTGVVTPGEYWINGDHIANPTASEPIFLDLGSSNNTYNLAGTSINVDTRKFDGFGRGLGHGSGVRIVQISGSDNTVNDLTLTGHDLEMDTDPLAQRHADWSVVYVKMTGDDNTVQGADVLTRGSFPYGYGDVFGKGARQDPQGWDPGPALDENGSPVGDGVGLPWIGHRKTSAFQVVDTIDAVINDMHLDVNTYGHGFFVQGTADNTTLTNSTVTGELFSSNDVIDTQLYQDYGFTSHGNVLPADMMISGNEDGVRMYNGPTGLTVNNVVVTHMRTGFSVALGRGTMTLNNVEAYGTENAFNFKSNTTITNAKGDITHGPLLHTPYDSASNTSVEVELVGGVPEGVDWSVAYVAGNNLDITIDSSLAAGALPENSLVRFGQVFFDNWRDSKHPAGPEDHGDNNYDYVNSTFHNNSNQVLVLGNEVTGNDGSSQGGVISNGKDNSYDGVTVVFNDSRLLVQHVNGLGNGGAAADGSLETNASVVADGSTLELQAGIRIVDEKLTITGDGVDGKGALFTDGDGARFGSSSGSDESTVFLDGNASIGVGGLGNELLIGRLDGTGDLTKRGEGALGIEKSSNLNGDLIVAEGHITGRSHVVRHGLTVALGASLSGISNNTINTVGDADVDGQLDLNARDSTFISNLNGTIGRLNGSGSITSSNPTTGSGGTLTFDSDGDDGYFNGTISGEVSLVKSGANTQTLTGILTHIRTTTINEGNLIVNGTHTGGGDYLVNTNGVLGGNGAIDSAVMVSSTGHLAPGASVGTLSVGDVTLSSGAFFDVELGGTAAGSEHDQLITGSATLGGVLSVSLLDLGGATYQPLPTNTFTVLTSSTSLSGSFENVANGQRLQTLYGEGTFLVTYTGSVVMLSDFEVAALDFGDAPSSYGTLIANDGARHVDQGPRLGSTRDFESDGQPDLNAGGDGNDDDGVMFGSITVSQTMAGVNIRLENAAEARVDAWVDFAGDGVWDASDRILDGATVFAGLQTLNYAVPPDALTGETFARVRLSTVGSLTPTGLAADGEVEDYRVAILASSPPEVESVQINGGEVQRSSLTEISVSFSMEVTTTDSAFTLLHRDTNTIVDSLAVNSSTIAGKTISKITFDPGALIVNRTSGVHSLADGNYQLIVNGAGVTAVNGGVSMQEDHTLGDEEADLFFRHFGDSDGDRDVDGQDYRQIALTYLKTDSDLGFNEIFDRDGDGDVDGQDFGSFRRNFLQVMN